MDTILTMFAIGIPVYDKWRHGFCKFPMMTTCFFTHTCELFKCFIETQKYTASCRDRVNIHIECTSFFFEKQAGCWFDTTNLTVFHGLHYLCALPTQEETLVIHKLHPTLLHTSTKKCRIK